MNIINYPSPNHSTRRVGTRVNTILLHHTATASTRAAMEWLCYRGSHVSAHYVVGAQGDIYRLVPEELKAWHAGLGRLPWETRPEYDFNHRSVGIEIVNLGDGKMPFAETQYQALEWLVPDIAQRLGWVQRVVGPGSARASGSRADGGFIYVLGHRDIAPGRKMDPADNFDWGRIRHALEGGST